MNDKELLDIYTDYLISSFGFTTGTGLSRLLDGAISHDRIQRFLASPVKSGFGFRARKAGIIQEGGFAVKYETFVSKISWFEAGDNQRFGILSAGTVLMLVAGSSSPVVHELRNDLYSIAPPVAVAPA